MLFKTSKTKIRRVAVDAQSDIATFLADRYHDGKIAARFERIILDPKSFYYLDNWAVSGFERWGLNDNADGFELEELKNSHRTFVGSWACLDHNNWHESLAIGTNVDAILTPDAYVRIVMGINRRKSEMRHPGLEQKINSGVITDLSMGCWARESVCTVLKCANVATDESQFCDHVRQHRGEELCTAETNWIPTKCGELNRGVIFFEDSIITDAEGADRNAKILNKLAVHRSGQHSIPADKLYTIIRDMAKHASKEEKVALSHIMEHLVRQL